MHQHHHHIAEPVTSLSAAYYVAIALNLGFVAVEATVGIVYNSLGLLSDSGHKLLDVLALIVSLLAFKLAKSRPDKHFTYGYRKASVLIAVLNAALLLVAVCVIIYESIVKFANPAPVDGAAISWTAAAGIIINSIGAILMMRHQKSDINTRGAFLHLATDALVSVGVVFAGIVISLTGWNVIDPIISLVIALVILVNTGKLLIEGVRMSIDAVPYGISYDDVKSIILAQDGVGEVRNLHIWPVSITETALTAELVVDDFSRAEMIDDNVRAALKALGISQITLEPRSRTRPNS